MSEAPIDLSGELVDGRFRVERRLGSGGMGTVWQVQHVESLQRFALKVLAPELAADPQITERLTREARATASLNSRHVVRNIDAQSRYTHRGQPTPYLVMELLEGETLDRLLARAGRLSHGELLWVARQIGRGLQAAHSAGIVHRDLKPANVFVARDEEGHPLIKLCDFGIAKLTRAARSRFELDSRSTAVGSRVGTPLYMAPEQLRGDRTVGPATDQWALGMLAFRALSGCDYFGDSRGGSDLVLRIAQDPLVPPSQKDAGIPSSFDRWFARACARQPARRFPNVSEAVAQLAPALGNPRSTPLGGPAANAEFRGSGAPRAHAGGRSAGAPKTLAAVVALGTVVMGVAIWHGHRALADRLEAAAVSGLSAVVAGLPRRAEPGGPAPDTGARGSDPARSAPQVEPPPSAVTEVSSVTSAGDSPAQAAPARPPRVQRAPPPRRSGDRPSGTACSRSAQCRSGLCVAELCR